jgi:hypothetical protein
MILQENNHPGMENILILGNPLAVSRVAVGTRAIGGWMWGGTDGAESTHYRSSLGLQAGYREDEITAAAT